MFQKHRIAILEKIIEDQKIAFAERLAELKELHQREVDVLKITHAEQQKYAIEEIARLRDDLDRTRLFLNPGLANVNTSRTPDTSGPPVPENVPVGGAWSRILAAYKKQDEEQQRIEEAERKRIAAEAPKVAATEAPNGSHS